MNENNPALDQQAFELLLQQVQASCLGVAAVCTREGELVFGHSTLQNITGKEKITAVPFELVHPDDAAAFKNLFSSKTVQQINVRLQQSNGSYCWLNGTVTPVDMPGAEELYILHLQDITEQKNTEEKLRKAKRLYYFLSQVNQMLVKTTNEQELFKQACNIAVDIGLFRMAWIGLIDEKTKLLMPVVHAGEEDNYLTRIIISSVDDKPEGKGPTGTAIREGRYIVCNDIENTPEMAPWKEAALGRNYHSSISLPIKKYGRVVGAYSLYADTKHFFDAAEIDLLEECTGDISFALETIENDKLRRNTEAALAESEERYHVLTEISPVGIFHTDTAGLTTYVNPRWCQISGMSFDAAMGNGWFNAVHPDDRESLQNGWAAATNKYSDSYSEYRFLRPNGTVTWVLGRAVPEKNAAGETVGYVGTTTDITDRKLAEEQIKKLYEEKQMVLNRITDAMVSVDTEWRYTFLNNAALSTHPEGREAVIGKQIWDVHPELTGSAFGEKYREAMQTGRAVEFENLYEPMGTWFYVKAYPSPSGLTIFYRDITEKKKAEETILANEQKLQLIYNTTKDVIFLLEVEGNLFRFLSVNQSFLDTTGLREDQVKGKLVNEIIPEPSLTLALEKYKQAIQNKKTVSWEEVSQYPKGVKTGIVNITPVIDSEGNCTMLVGSVYDITERKQTEDQIKTTTSQLRHLTTHLQRVREDERKRIGQEIHDDLGQLLTAVKMDAVWIDKKLPGDSAALKAKTQNILTLLDTGHQSVRRILNELKPGALDERDLSTALAWQNQQFTQNTEIPVEFICNTNGIVFSEAVAICLFRVYQEALTNVMRYAAATLVTAALEIKEKNITLTVSDNGHGFDMAVLKTKSSFGILGMRERALSLGGYLELVAAPGKGTHITVAIPLSSNE